MPRRTHRRSLLALILVALVAPLLVQSPAAALPDAPEGLTPLDGTEVTDNPILHWEPVSGATSYRVQASTSPTFTPLLGSVNQTTVNTNFTPLTAIPTGVIHWRVAAIDGSGQGEFTTSTFERVLDGPTQLTPVDDPDGLTPLPYPGTPVRFTWQSLSYANSYELQIDDAEDFVGATIVKTDATSYTLPEAKEPGQNFFWRVRGATDTGGSGVLSEWSDIWEFRTSWTAAAGLTKPSPDETTVTDIELEWTAVLGADHYELQISTDDEFNVIDLTVGTVYGTRYSPPTTLDNEEYHWRVRPVDADGNPGTWSQIAEGDPFTFSREWEPAPTPVSPTVTMNNPPTFSWTPTQAPGSASQSESVYQIQVDDNSGFTSPSVCTTAHTMITPYDGLNGDTGTPAECNTIFTMLTAGPTYWWRVRGIDNPQAVVGIWSAVEDFTYVGPPAPTAGSTMTPATMVAPADCDLECTDSVPASPLFDWDPIAGADYYLIIVSNDANFTNIHSRWRVDDHTSFRPNSEFEDNDAGEAYYWHVRACDADPPVDVCSTDPEATVDPPSFAFQKRSADVVLTSPADDPAGLPETPIANLPRFSWQDYQDSNSSDVSAVQYRIHVATDPSFGAVIDNRVVDQPFYTPYALTYPEGPLWWRVRAVDASGNELTWSPTRRLLKQSPVLTHTSPANGANVGVTPTFDWSDQTYAAEYVVEVYRNDPTMTFPSGNRVVNQTTPYSEWTNPSPLAPGTGYSWRVRREDGQGRDGPWSAGRTFNVTASGTVAGLTPCNGDTLPNDFTVYSWDVLPSAVTYRFERSASPTFTTIAESRVTVMNAWAQTALLPKGTWYWRVVPLDAGDDPIGTTWSTCTVVRGTLPSQPTSLSIVDGLGRTTISWGAPLQAGDPPFETFRVNLEPGGIERVVGSTVRTVTINGLMNGTVYTVEVVAVSDAGESPPAVDQAEPNGCDDTPFSDVAADHLFCEEISWLYNEGITTGSTQSDGRIMYQPSAPVTRLAMAAFVHRFHDSPAPSPLSPPFFSDFTTNSPANDFYEAIQWMGTSGLSTGTPNPPGAPLYKPNEAVSRQAMSAFLHRDAGDDPPISATPYFADVGSGNTFFEDIQWMNETGLSTGTPNPPGKPLFRPNNPVSRQAMAAFLFRYDEYLNEVP
jgi:large repetitive protein